MKWTAVPGFAYGLVLVLLAGYTAGFGHGLYAPLGLASTPLSLIGVRSAVFATPFLWSLIGFLIGFVGRRRSHTLP